MTLRLATGIVLGMTNFEVGKGNRVLAQISDAAAELLAEAHEPGPLGVELDGIFARGLARELESEDLGHVALDCGRHGMLQPQTCAWACDETVSVFVIGDAGVEWLADSERSA